MHGAARKLDATQLVTAASAGYIHWLAHMHRNLLLLGLARRLTVCATDEETLGFARARGMRVRAAFVASQQSGTGATFGTRMWYNLVHEKQHCVWGMLESAQENSTILLLDSDITLFHDPLPFLMQHVHPSTDVAFMDDRGGRFNAPRFLNTGFVFMRATQAAREFGRVYTYELLRNRSKNDQSVLNDLLNWRGTTLGARLQVIAPNSFLNGYRFYEDRGLHPINVSTTVAVHHNWIKGDRNKWNRATAYETILNYDNETLGHFRRRARRAMLHMPAWQYRNPHHPGNEIPPAPISRPQHARPTPRNPRHPYNEIPPRQHAWPTPRGGGESTKRLGAKGIGAKGIGAKGIGAKGGGDKGGSGGYARLGSSGSGSTLEADGSVRQGMRARIRGGAGGEQRRSLQSLELDRRKATAGRMTAPHLRSASGHGMSNAHVHSAAPTTSGDPRLGGTWVY